MIVHDYDATTESIVSLEAFYGKPKKIVEKCMITFSEAIHKTLLQRYACSVIGEISACNGNIGLYQFESWGEPIAFYLSGTGAPVASEQCYEAHWLTGATKFILFGSCGSLDRTKTNGKYIIPTESYRGEGCSYYYAEPADYISIRNADTVSAVFEELGVPYVKGRVWTTDSMLRETIGLARKRKREGCLAVEMELAAVEAVCDFYGLALFPFLETGDILEGCGYDVKALSKANHDTGKLSIALEIAKRV